MLLANMRPPEVRIQLDPQFEPFYQIATPLFVSLAIACFGKWYFRYQSLLTRTARLYLIVGAGCLAAAFVTLTTWQHRNGELITEAAFTLAPWIYTCAAIAFLLVSRIVVIGSEPVPRSDWPEMLTLLLMFCSLFFGAVLTGGRLHFWAPITMALWVLAFLVYLPMSFIRGREKIPSIFLQKQGETSSLQSEPTPLTMTGSVECPDESSSPKAP